MSGTDHKWIEWVFSGIGVAIVIGVIAWLRSRKKPQTTTASQTNSLAIGAGASLVGAPIAVGSNNTQNVTLNIPAQSEHVPIQNRKPSFPSANQIWKQAESSPPFQRQDALNNGVGLNVSWPVRLVNIQKYKAEDSVYVAFVYGHEGKPDGRAIVCQGVRVEEYPILKVAEQGQRGWIDGKISQIDSSLIHLEDVKLQFE